MMKAAKNNSIFVNSALHFLGLTLCIAPPALCALLYFPLWAEGGGGRALAGGAAFVMALCFMPLYKFIRRVLASSSSYLMWLIIFLFFFLTAKIAAQMTVISFVGFLSNLAGGALMRIAKRGRK